MTAKWKTKYQYSDDVWDAVEGAITGLCASVVSGVLLYMAFPPVSWWFLSWFALVPMLTAQYQTLPDEISWMAAPTTAVTFLSLHFNKVSVGFALGSDAFSPILRVLLQSKEAILLTIFVSFSVLSMGSRYFQRRSIWRFQVLEPVLFWMGLDHLRDSAPALGTSVSFAYSQFTVPFVVRVSSLIGTIGVTGMIVAVNAALLARVLATKRDDRGYLWRHRPSATVRARLLSQSRATFIFTGLLLAYGLISGLAASSTPPRQDDRVTVGLVQPGRKMTFEYDKGLYALRNLTLEASMSGAKIVVWPEASFRDDPRIQDIWPSITAIAAESGCYLVVPYFTEDPAAASALVDVPDVVPRFVNEGLLVSPSGEVLGAGAKDHPVALLGETSVTRGTYPVFDTEIGKIGIMICYDLNFTNTARRLRQAGAEILCVPTNDWKAVSQAQYMYAIYRAAENGLVVVKADSIYDSCIVAPDGVIVRKAVSYAGETAVLVANVPLRRTAPLAVHLGSLPGLLSLIAWLGFMGWSLRSRRR